MKEIIDQLVYRLDEETAWISSRKQAVVCVPQEVHTPYLMAVRSKAHALGVRILREKRAGLPCVLDAEAKADGLFLGRDEDVDNLWHDGMSCCAEAVFMAMIVAGWDLRSCRTLIVGRGHSVKGLAERLVFNDATVTIAPSRSWELAESMKSYELLINSAPALPESITSRTPEGCVDISGALGDTHGDAFFGPKDIGRLNISILLNRVATGKR